MHSKNFDTSHSIFIKILSIDRRDTHDEIETKLDRVWTIFIYMRVIQNPLEMIRIIYKRNWSEKFDLIFIGRISPIYRKHSREDTLKNTKVVTLE